MSKGTGKPRIALLSDGTLGGSYSGQGIPVLNDLFTRLSQHYTFYYYSFRSINASCIPKAIRVTQVTRLKLPGRIKFSLLALRIIWDHLFEPVSIIFCVSDYPGGFFGVLLGKILRRPSLVQLIAFEAVKLEDIGYGNLLDPASSKITRFVCKRADVLITVAEYQRKMAALHLPTSRTIEVLPLRINPEHFIYRKRKVEYPVQFLQVAYYSALKDQHTLFKAFALIAKQIECRLTVVGEGFDTPEVETLLTNLNILEKIDRVGFVSQTELPLYYDRAHIFLHAARFETGCAVIQEAMASGVAVCGTDVGLLSDIGDRYAAVVPPSNPEKMAEGILSLVNDSRSYERITDAAFKWISQNNATWSSGNYQIFLDKLLEKENVKIQNFKN